MKRIFLAILGLCSLSQIALAAPNVGQKRTARLNKAASGCAETTAVIDLDVNNVRARLMSGGDMWWDIPAENASYEVPKGSNKNALFAGSVWIGGYDNGANQLKVAAQTYRQSGNDYWTGPLDQNQSVNFQTCAEWDRFWKINASDVNTFRTIYENAVTQQDIQAAIANNNAIVADVIKEWPAKGNTDAKGSGGSLLSDPIIKDMAPFVDLDSNGKYEWKKGDYPQIMGDQYIWWVFNDKGDAKTETGSDAIGLEIHAAAFAFSTNNCLNDATFYNYKINNYSTSDLDSTYMATWCDADLGYAFDDYVGCDTGRGLGILYNGDGFDNGAQGYGFDIPMVGIDFFQGPQYTVGGDTFRLNMSVFTYYNNTQNTPTGNPSALDDFYGYISGTWKDGQPFTKICNTRDNAPTTKFIFTDDPCSGGWFSEANCNNAPDDRRFIHSAGPFKLEAGAAPNNITIGAVWVPNVGGGKAACFGKIQVCDDIAQDLFRSNFKLPFGPNAPQMTAVPLDKKVVFDLDNIENSNNFAEGYGTNMDPKKTKMREFSAKARDLGYADSLYKFEGYVVYQLKNSTVSVADIRASDGSINTDVARIVFQCDKRNGIKEIFNYEPNPEIDPTFYIPKKMAEGVDTGISHSFQVTQDLFATGTSKSLVNYKNYYYVAIAYAYNNFKKFNPNSIDSTQNIQYLESRTDGKQGPIQVLEVMPHPANDSLYIETYADYGTGIQLKRIEGRGNGGMNLEMTEASEMEAVLGSNFHCYNPVYKGNFGPMMMKVVNPDSLKSGNYEVRFRVDSAFTGIDSAKGLRGEYARWMVIKEPTSANPDTVWSETNLNGPELSEKYLRKYNQFDWGISAAAHQVLRPGDNPTLSGIENGLISSSIQFDDITKPWLDGVHDADGKSFLNWIRSGSEFQDNKEAAYNNCSMIDYDNGVNSDGEVILNNKDLLNTFEKVVSGTWAPYNLASNERSNLCGYGVQLYTAARTQSKLEDVSSVDIVFTSDRKLWSRCVVVETTDNPDLGATPISENKIWRNQLRGHNGWNGDVDAQGRPVYSSDPNDYGMSYFPGYAINQETGERLNIFFGESSIQIANNGNDMIFNPTNVLRDFATGAYIYGGKHPVYVSKSKYDGCAEFRAKFIETNNSSTFGTPDSRLRDIYNTVQWVGFTMLGRGQIYASYKDGIIPTPTRVRIRVTRPYVKYTPDPSATVKNNGWPLYSFNTSDLVPANIGDTRNAFTSDKDAIFKRIQPVPNPYYAVSEYEGNKLDTRIRIINLPTKATLKIYTLDGILVRTIEKNDTKTSYVDWDLKNQKNIPISSGMYLIHVILPGIGETTLKWFGAMRPTDITSF